MIGTTRIVVWLVSGKSTDAVFLQKIRSWFWRDCMMCWREQKKLIGRLHPRYWCAHFGAFLWSEGGWERSGHLTVFSLLLGRGVGWWEAWGNCWYNLRIVFRVSLCLLTPSDCPYSPINASTYMGLHWVLPYKTHLAAVTNPCPTQQSGASLNAMYS